MLPFQGVRVIEVGSGTALAFCGKLFADFGAEVVKVEPPGGDPARRQAPLAATGGASGGGHEESAYFAWLNTNKRSITADLASEPGLQRLRSLVASSDVVLDARALGAGGADLPNLHGGNAGGRQVEVAFSWFGESGPYSGYVATEAVCRALAGVIHGAGPVEGPPVIPHDTQSGVVAGLAGFTTAVAGLYGRERGGRRYAISVHEALLHLIEIDIGLALEGRAAPRSGINRYGAQYPASIYATSDGWIGIFTVTAPQWRGLCKVLGKPELASDPRFLDGASRLAHADQIDAILSSVFATRSAAHWFEACGQERLPAVIVPTMAQLLRQAVHRERGAFVPVRIGDACFEGPVLAQRMGDAGPLPGGRAPFAGEHDHLYQAGPVVKEAEEAEEATGMDPAAPRALPLEGVRIIDLTMGWAGPFATRHLADLGAEVIKVESTRYPDWWRGTSYTGEYYSEQRYEKSAYFNLMNRNKLGVTLDLSDPEGVRIFKQLVATANAVIDNYSAEVLPKLGLDYAALSQVNPDIVMVSMPAFGSNNAWSNTRAYGGTLEQASGLPTLTGKEGWPPTMASYAYGDPIGGYNAAAALLAGLSYQQRTGKGRFIDLSQVEGMLSLAAPAIIEQSLTGRLGPRPGNRNALYSPHGCFRCQGKDDWIVLAIADDAQWKSLCRVIGRADLAEDSALDAQAGRRRREDDIEAAIGAWTARHSADQAMALLQHARIPAGVARSIGALLDDPHLRERGFWRKIERAFVGDYLSGTSFYREDGRPAPIRNGAPTLGQHNSAVLAGKLGLSQDEIGALSAAGVIGTEAVLK